MRHQKPHAAVVDGWTQRVYPGFEEFATYFDSCWNTFPSFTPGVFIRDNAIWFGEEVRTRHPHGMDNIEGPAGEMTKILNGPEFRWMWNLLPAGTDAFTAFIQLYTMMNASVIDLGDWTGTYTIRVAACREIMEQQLEGPHAQTHRMSLEAVEGSWGTTEVTVFLAAGARAADSPTTPPGVTHG